jgi:hypothetical protein
VDPCHVFADGRVGDLETFLLRVKAMRMRTVS